MPPVSALTPDAVHARSAARLRSGAFAMPYVAAMMRARWSAFLHATSCVLAAKGLAFVPAASTALPHLGIDVLAEVDFLLGDAYHLTKAGHCLPYRTLAEKGLNAGRQGLYKSVSLSVFHALQAKGLVLVRQADSGAAAFVELSAHALHVGRAVDADLYEVQWRAILRALRAEGVELRRGATGRLQDLPAAPAIGRVVALAAARLMAPDVNDLAIREMAHEWLALQCYGTKLAGFDTVLQRLGVGPATRPAVAAVDHDAHQLPTKLVARMQSVHVQRLRAQTAIEALADAVDALEMRWRAAPADRPLPAPVSRALAEGIGIAVGSWEFPAKDEEEQQNWARYRVEDGAGLEGLRELLACLGKAGMHLAPPTSDKAWLNPAGHIRRHRRELLRARRGHLGVADGGDALPYTPTARRLAVCCVLPSPQRGSRSRR
ncbi:hypothetical protein [Cupriavidus pampae]|nr:hypothetical protein [Cupriavidus pampae]